MIPIETLLIRILDHLMLALAVMGWEVVVLLVSAKRSIKLLMLSATEVSWAYVVM
jgi:uncharacterized membrane protein